MYKGERGRQICPWACLLLLTVFLQLLLLLLLLLLLSGPGTPAARAFLDWRPVCLARDTRRLGRLWRQLLSGENKLAKLMVALSTSL